MSSTATTIDESASAAAGALTERLLEGTLAVLETACVHLGSRLGLYRAIDRLGAPTSAELAAATSTDERYVREWLEQQAVARILEVDDPEAPANARRFRLPPGHAEALLDAVSPLYGAALPTLAVGCLRPLDALVDAFRSGSGVPYADYGEDTREGIAGMNRPMFHNDLGTAWLPAVPEVDRRLRAEPPARVADLACGVGWSTIAIARAYPLARVDGLDVDGASIARARENLAGADVGERVRFLHADGADPRLEGRYDLVTIFEALHDMARPVEVLRAARALLAADGCVVVADERVADRFTPDGDPTERLMYGFSVLHCLAVGREDEHSAATGTVIRAQTVREYALAAGFAEVETLPIENDFWRFYRLRP
jgi:SAM-dependent methyltransferase